MGLAATDWLAGSMIDPLAAVTDQLAGLVADLVIDLLSFSP
jgi:hypothetical protein